MIHTVSLMQQVIHSVAVMQIRRAESVKRRLEKELALTGKFPTAEACFSFYSSFLYKLCEAHGCAWVE